MHRSRSKAVWAHRVLLLDVAGSSDRPLKGGWLLP